MHIRGLSFHLQQTSIRHLGSSPCCVILKKSPLFMIVSSVSISHTKEALVPWIPPQHERQRRMPHSCHLCRVLLHPFRRSPFDQLVSVFE